MKYILYRNLKEIVTPEHTALVVWDMQNFLIDSIFNKAELLQHLKSFLAAARSIRIPIIYTKITSLPEQYDTPWRTFMQMQRYNVDDPKKLPPFVKAGTPESEIYQEVSPAHEDVVLNKHTPSIFIGTHFEYMMRNRGINTILFTGIYTEIGVDSSARDASNRGFYTIVVADCASSPDKDLHESALKTLKRVCLVKPSRDIIHEWQ